MDKKSPEIIVLRTKIEQSIERVMKTPSDFDFLSGVIWERLKEYISPTTLKRTWGYIGGATTIRNSTLVILAKFAGYKDWEDYLKQICEKSDIESSFFDGATINTDKLTVGDMIEVTWSPNRHCTFKYIGDYRFEVVISENSKLREGDTFEAHFFIEGEPLYMDNLKRGSNPPTAYLCGNKNGLNSIQLIIK